MARWRKSMEKRQIVERSAILEQTHYGFLDKPTSKSQDKATQAATF